MGMKATLIFTESTLRVLVTVTTQGCITRDVGRWFNYHNKDFRVSAKMDHSKATGSFTPVVFGIGEEFEQSYTEDVALPLTMEEFFMRATGHGRTLQETHQFMQQYYSELITKRAALTDDVSKKHQMHTNLRSRRCHLEGVCIQLGNAVRSLQNMQKKQQLQDMTEKALNTIEMDWQSSNLPDAWRRFKQHTELMFSGPLSQQTEEQKCSFLLLWIGDKGRDISNTWALTEGKAKLLKTYYDGFTAYTTPKANPIFARYKFHEEMQDSGESFEHFVTELKLLVKDCDYANSDEMVRDRIVFATNSPRVREKLLSQGPELTLEKAIDIGLSHELAQLQLKAMASDSQEVHAIHRRTNKQSFAKQANKPNESQKMFNKGCGACGGNHSKHKECPAKGKQCLKCKKYNHFAKVCRTKSYPPSKNEHKEVHSVRETQDDSESGLFIDTVTATAEEEGEDSAFADIELGPNTEKLTFKLDTGAQTSVIPTRIFNNLMSSTPLKKDKHKLYGYGGHPLKVMGCCKLVSRYKNKSISEKFYIVDCNNPPILGYKACKALGLIKVVYAISGTSNREPTNQSTNILSEYSDVL
ncbi:hypothetical protein NFI96_007835 [Prochilodus magdalenae]|nr:hypothetical protein NFI96_007835 [Prochilodus magdalenae]